MAMPIIASLIRNKVCELQNISCDSFCLLRVLGTQKIEYESSGMLLIYSLEAEKEEEGYRFRWQR